MSNVIYPSQFVCPIDGTTPNQRLKSVDNEVTLCETLESMECILFDKVVNEVQEAMTGEYGIDDWDTLTKQQALAIEKCLNVTPEGGILEMAIEHLIQVYSVEDQLVSI